MKRQYTHSVMNEMTFLIFSFTAKTWGISENIFIWWNHIGCFGVDFPMHSSEKYILFGLPNESDSQDVFNFCILHMKNYIYMSSAIHIAGDISWGHGLSANDHQPSWYNGLEGLRNTSTCFMYISQRRYIRVYKGVTKTLCSFKL